MSDRPKPIEIIEFKTDRLHLRQWRDSDRAPFAQLNGDPIAMEYFPSTLTQDESDAMAERCRSLIADRGWGFWAVEHQASQQFIGFVGLHVPTDQLPFAPCVEIGWRLLPDYWGQGFATEAARSVLKVGFTQLELARIVSFTAIENRRSQAVMKRLGMTFCGTFGHPRVAEGYWLHPHCWYELLA
jgi:RimJ/RimL family protein N-acetyltransferase